MVTGWRRAFCTSIPKDKHPKISTQKQPQQDHSDDTTANRSPKISSKFGFFSNPSTPRLQSQPVSSSSLRCRTTTTPTAATTTPTSSVPNSPKLQCKVSSSNPKKNNTNSPRLFHFSNPSSPKSPSSFSLLKSTFRLSKLQTRCGICLQSVKAGQGMAIFTAECSHSFHFPCIASHVKKNQILVCPVCSTGWKELPLLSIHHGQTTTTTNKINEAYMLRDVKTTANKCLRVYDDDEPLMSPTSGARFNPIPETDENELGDDEIGAAAEFQGFFVNAPRTPPQLMENGGGGGGRGAKNVEVRLQPEAAIVAVGRSYETYAVVLRVKAPAVSGTTSSLLNPARRAPVDLVTVVDVGATMSCVKIQMLKRTMRLLISSLSSSDRLSIVAFSSASKRLLPLRRMTSAGKRSARRIVDALGAVAGKGMSVGDAIKKAAKVLEDRREKNPVATIILFSESSAAANQKRSSTSSALTVSSTRFSNFNIPVHAVGFSEPSSDDALAKCVGSLLSVVVQDLRLQLGFASGSSPAEIAATYSLTSHPAALGNGPVRLGDLYAEEERELLLELKVPTSSVGSHQVLSVRSSHRDPSSMELVYSRDQALVVARPQAVRSSSPNIQRIRNLHVVTRAVAESSRLVEHGDLSGAQHLLSSARALLLQSSSASSEEYLRGLEAEISELNRLRHHQLQQSQRQRTTNRTNEKPEPLTPTSAWRAAERLAKVAIMRKSMNRVSDLHGFENARF